MLKALVENLRKIFGLPSVKSVAFSVTHALVQFAQTEKQSPGTREMEKSQVKLTIFSATQRCNIVVTLFRMVTTLFQH